MTTTTAVGRLLSVNVGLPTDIEWEGRTVHTGIWKSPVDGPQMVRRLNIDGDGQGDLQGHGGVNRAVYVYQIESHHYWEKFLKRDDFSYGQFGENFTVDGLADDEVCIGDRYSRPQPDDRKPEDLYVAGRLTADVIDQAGVPVDADFYLCGPHAFMHDISAALTARGSAPDRVSAEVFGAEAAITPGVVGAKKRAPHPPAGQPGPGPSVSFSRSNLTVRWDPAFAGLLELAEACDVPVRWSCRTGVCRTCVTGLVSGKVRYQPEPLEPAGEGSALICVSQPDTEITLDL